MEVSIIFKIGAVGILVSVLSQILKHSGREEQAFLVILVSVMCQVLKHSGREDQAFLTSLAGLILVLFWIVPYIYELFENIQQLFVL